MFSLTKTSNQPKKCPVISTTVVEGSILAAVEALALVTWLPPRVGADAERRNAALRPLVVAEAALRPALRGAGVRGLKAHVVSAA